MIPVQKWLIRTEQAHVKFFQEQGWSLQGKWQQRYPEIDAEILPIFDIVPMKFSDGEKEISDYWKKYYVELGVPVPAGQPVTNPGQLAKSEKLKYIGKLEF